MNTIYFLLAYIYNTTIYMAIENIWGGREDGAACLVPI
jgi:hypothetical protein